MCDLLVLQEFQGVQIVKTVLTKPGFGAKMHYLFKQKGAVSVKSMSSLLSN